MSRGKMAGSIVVSPGDIIDIVDSELTEIGGEVNVMIILRNEKKSNYVTVFAQEEAKNWSRIVVRSINRVLFYRTRAGASWWNHCDIMITAGNAYGAEPTICSENSRVVVKQTINNEAPKGTVMPGFTYGSVTNGKK